MQVNLNSRQVKDFLGYFPSHKQADVVEELLLLSIHLVLQRLSSLNPPQSLENAIEEISQNVRPAHSLEQEHCPEVLDAELKSIKRELRNVTERLATISQHPVEGKGLRVETRENSPNFKQQKGRKQHLALKVTEVRPEGSYLRNPIRVRNVHLDDHQVKAILQYDCDPPKGPSKPALSASCSTKLLKDRKDRSSIQEYNRRLEHEMYEHHHTPAYLRKAESKIKLLVDKNKEEFKRRRTEVNQMVINRPKEGLSSNPEAEVPSRHTKQSAEKAAIKAKTNYHYSTQPNMHQRLHMQSPEQLLKEDTSSVSDFSQYEYRPERKTANQKHSPADEYPSSHFDSRESSTLGHQTKKIGTISRRRKDDKQVHQAP